MGISEIPPLETTGPETHLTSDVLLSIGEEPSAISTGTILVSGLWAQRRHPLAHLGFGLARPASVSGSMKVSSISLLGWRPISTILFKTNYRRRAGFPATATSSSGPSCKFGRGYRKWKRKSRDSAIMIPEDRVVMQSGGGTWGAVQAFAVLSGLVGVQLRIELKTSVEHHRGPPGGCRVRILLAIGCTSGAR